MSEEHSRSVDVVVYVVLVSCILVNYGLSKLDLGAAGVWVALGIALFQAVLILVVYMDLRDQHGARRFALFGALLFLLLLIGLTLADVATRWMPATPHFAEHVSPPQERPLPTRTNTNAPGAPQQPRMPGE